MMLLTEDTPKLSKPIMVAQPGTAAWYAARETGLGASEISAAAGLSTYQTPRELYHRKRGELPPIEENDAMRLGKRLEPVIKAEFVDRTGISLLVDEPWMYRHGEREYLFATPDGILDDGSLLECKATTWRMSHLWGDEGSDFVPQEYVCQVQQQMGVCNADLCHLAVLFDGRTLRCYRIPRNDKLISLLWMAAENLWERIQIGDPPPPSFEHSSTPALIKDLFKAIRDTRIELSPASRDAWAEYERLGKEAGTIEKRRKDLKSRVLLEIGEHGAGLLGDGRMVRRQQMIVPVQAHVKDYVDARAVKIPKDDQGIIVAADPVEELIELESRRLEVCRLLEEAGAVQRDMSEFGSVYWRLPNGRDLRVADHPANRKTREWMQGVDAAEIRVDFPELNLAAAVAALLV